MSGESRPSVVVGDHIYYAHPEHGPQVGEVVAHGADGAQVRHSRDGGGIEPVRWSAMLGHKARKARRFRVLESGEDGAICEDDDGQRVFLRGHVPAGDSPMGGVQPMAKSLPLGGEVDGEMLQVGLLELARAQAEISAALSRIEVTLAAVLAASSNAPGAGAED